MSSVQACGYAEQLLTLAGLHGMLFFFSQSLLSSCIINFEKVNNHALARTATHRRVNTHKHTHTHIHTQKLR